MINVEYKNKDNIFSLFLSNVKDKKVAVVCDKNTQIFAKNIINSIDCVAKTVSLCFDENELVPNEENCEKLLQVSKGSDYVLAVGSGTLNDMAKDIATKLGIKSAVLATAPSMDGYASCGAALLVGGIKVTNVCNAPSDILIDLDIVCFAPKEMIGAGFGDIVGKYTCLTDWQLSSFVNGEQINVKAFNMMQTALNDCMQNYAALTTFSPESVSKLMNALITAGLAMEECGNSRPASGSEHHMSHFLEMDFISRGEKVPLHGIKVGIGTLISLELYAYLLDNNIKFKNSEKVYDIVKKLPNVGDVKNMLIAMNCPVKFSQIGVREDVMKNMLEKAYLVRDRFTILTLINQLNLTNKIMPIIMSKYY